MAERRLAAEALVVDPMQASEARDILRAALSDLFATIGVPVPVMFSREAIGCRKSLPSDLILRGSPANAHRAQALVWFSCIDAISCLDC